MRDLSSQPGIEPRPPAVKVCSPNHWTTRDVPGFTFLRDWGKEKKIKVRCENHAAQISASTREALLAPTVLIPSAPSVAACDPGTASGPGDRVLWLPSQRRSLSAPLQRRACPALRWPACPHPEPPSQGAGPGGQPALALCPHKVRGVDPLAAPSSEVAAALAHLVLAATHWGGRARPRCVLSRFSRVRLCATPWPVTRQAPLSVGFSRQESWSGLPCPPPPPSSLGISVPTKAAEPMAGL